MRCSLTSPFVDGKELAEAAVPKQLKIGLVLIINLKKFFQFNFFKTQ